MSLQLFIESGEGSGVSQCIFDNIPHILSSVEECDYIISNKIPWGCANPQFIQTVLDSYKNTTKKVLVFLVSDYNEPFDIPSNVIFFRTGFYKSQKKPNEHLFPFFAAKAEIKNHTSLAPLPKISLQPIIGFCGYVVSHPSRLTFINKLKMTPNIKKNLILRNEYWGGNPHNQQVVNEFINNIKNSHFTLTTRGTGNWSARFYQVLYLGRIPLFINTDMMLPFEDRINWRDVIVYCDSENDIGNNLKNFWNTKDIVQAQMRCKEIFDTYLTPEKWSKIITEEILLPNK
jgi:hypothetical protein